MDRYIAQYGRRLYGLCLKLCGSVHAAEDLYQETWLKALSCFHQYDVARPFEPWLTRICVNTYRNLLQRMKRSPIFNGFLTTAAKDAALENVPQPQPPDNSPLLEAVNRLPEKLRLAVILYYFRYMDTAETALALGIPSGTVKSRLNKAKKLLKEALGNEYAL